MKLIVVGATGTIGRAVTSALEGNGHEVLKASRNSELKLDLADPASIKGLYQKTGRVDGVICCAGNAALKPLLELDDGDIRLSLSDNLPGRLVSALRVPPNPTNLPRPSDALSSSTVGCGAPSPPMDSGALIHRLASRLQVEDSPPIDAPTGPPTERAQL